MVDSVASFHHVSNEKHLERVDRVFARDVKAAASHLLGEDGAAHDEDGEGVRHGGRDEERQERLGITR